MRDYLPPEAWWRRILCPALLAAVVGLAPLQAAPPVWLKLATAEFVIYSDAPEKQVVECALRYAAYRRAFGTLLLAPGRTLPPSTLLLFRKDKSFRALTPASTEKNTKLVNYSCEVDGTPLTAFTLAGDLDRALELTFEFETIGALRDIGHFVPLWMSQGAGEVLSTVTYAKGRCLIGEDRNRSFNATFDWPHFFEIGEYSKEYRAGQRDLPDYLNQAWGLMHWILLTEGDSRARFGALEQQLRNRPALDAVTTVMNTPVDQLAKSIRRHFAPPRAVPFDEAATKAGFRITPALEAEVLVQTANLLCSTGRLPECDLHLDRARTLSPGLAIVNEAWARRMLRESRPRDAIQFYREAIDAGSQNFSAYYQSAVMRLDDNMTGGADRAGEGGPEALKAIAELHRALALHPGQMGCYRSLGRAFYVAPHCDQSQLDELAEAVGPGDNGQEVRYYRALLCSRLHRRAECAADFRTILADSHISDRLRQAVRHQFVREILSFDATEVERLARSQDYAAAFAIVASGENEPEPELSSAYARLRTWLKKAVRLDDHASAADRQLAGLD